MTTTDGEREIAKQLKRIADALAGPEEDTSFADAPKRLVEVPTESSNPVWERIMRDRPDNG